VPFRHLAHAITAYALNGSDMHIEIKGSVTDPYDPDRPVTLEVMVPNSWFVKMLKQKSLKQLDRCFFNLFHLFVYWYIPRYETRGTQPARVRGLIPCLRW
jgi:hypothetical protein